MTGAIWVINNKKKELNRDDMSIDWKTWVGLVLVIIEAWRLELFLALLLIMQFLVDSSMFKGKHNMLLVFVIETYQVNTKIDLIHYIHTWIKKRDNNDNIIDFDIVLPS